MTPWGAPKVSYKMGSAIFSRSKPAGATRLRISGCIHLLPLHAFTLSTRVNLPFLTRQWIAVCSVSTTILPNIQQRSELHLDPSIKWNINCFSFPIKTHATVYVPPCPGQYKCANYIPIRHCGHHF